MSMWTYISGSIGLERFPYNFVLDKDGSIKYHPPGNKDYSDYAQLTLPYPEEQFEIKNVEPMHLERKENGKNRIVDGFEIGIELTSFPIVKREVDSLIKGLPEGESSVINYSLIKDDFARSSSTSFDSPQAEKMFRRECLKKFSLWDGCTWKDMEKYRPIQLDMENHNEDSILTIHDSVRYCYAYEMYGKVMDFLSGLIDRGISFSHGCFCFSDIMCEEYFLTIDQNSVKVRIKNLENQNEREEFYQVHRKKDNSAKEKRFPCKYCLKKVDKINEEDSWPIVEEEGNAK